MVAAAHPNVGRSVTLAHPVFPGPGDGFPRGSRAVPMVRRQCRDVRVAAVAWWPRGKWRPHRGAGAGTEMTRHGKARGTPLGTACLIITAGCPDNAVSGECHFPGEALK